MQVMLGQPSGRRTIGPSRVDSHGLAKPWVPWYLTMNSSTAVNTSGSWRRAALAAALRLLRVSCTRRSGALMVTICCPGEEGCGDTTHTHQHRRQRHAPHPSAHATHLAEVHVLSLTRPHAHMCSPHSLTRPRAHMCSPHSLTRPRAHTHAEPRCPHTHHTPACACAQRCTGSANCAGRLPGCPVR